MKKFRTLFFVFVFAMVGVIVSGCGAGIQDEKYPVRPITLIIPFETGGGNDITGRIVASYLEKELGQPVVVVNRAGANGEIGYTEMTNAKPDGYTIGSVNYPGNVVLTSYRKATFSNDDLLPIAAMTKGPIALAVGKNSPFKTLEEFIQYAKINPGKLTLANAGDDHILTMVLLEDAAGIDLTTVTYKSGGRALSAVLGGHVDGFVLASQHAMIGAEQGVRTLAVSSGQRVNKLPDAPSFKEKGYEVENYLSRLFVLPKGTPEPIVKKLVAAFEKISKDQEMSQKILATGDDFNFMSGKELQEYMAMLSSKTEKVTIQHKDAFIGGQ